LSALQARHERVKIHERVVKVRERERRLVDRQSVERALYGRTQRLREALEAWPTQVAPLIVALVGGELRRCSTCWNTKCAGFWNGWRTRWRTTSALMIAGARHEVPVVAQFDFPS